MSCLRFSPALWPKINFSLKDWVHCQDSVSNYSRERIACELYPELILQLYLTESLTSHCAALVIAKYWLQDSKGVIADGEQFLQHFPSSCCSQGEFMSSRAEEHSKASVPCQAGIYTIRFITCLLIQIHSSWKQGHWESINISGRPCISQLLLIILHSNRGTFILSRGTNHSLWVWS